MKNPAARHLKLIESIHQETGELHTLEQQMPMECAWDMLGLQSLVARKGGLEQLVVRNPDQNSERGWRYSCARVYQRPQNELDLRLVQHLNDASSFYAEIESAHAVERFTFRDNQKGALLQLDTPEDPGHYVSMEQLARARLRYLFSQFEPELKQSRRRRQLAMRVVSLLQE